MDEGTAGPLSLATTRVTGAVPRGARTLVQVGFESLEAARRVLLGLGGAAKVLEPKSLRDSVRDFAKQVLSVYQR